MSSRLYVPAAPTALERQGTPSIYTLSGTAGTDVFTFPVGGSVDSWLVMGILSPTSIATPSLDGGALTAAAGTVKIVAPYSVRYGWYKRKLTSTDLVTRNVTMTNPGGGGQIVMMAIYGGAVNCNDLSYDDDNNIAMLNFAAYTASNASLGAVVISLADRNVAVPDVTSSGWTQALKANNPGSPAWNQGWVHEKLSTMDGAAFTFTGYGAVDDHAGQMFGFSN